MSLPSNFEEPAPTKASLLRWWRAFTSGGSSNASSSSAAKRQYVPPAYQPPRRGLGNDVTDKGKRVFGVSPEQSLKYASVAISMIADDGKPYVYGYVPIVVAKCGMMLKESATHTEGIFRVSGSNKRINQLQEEFDSPPRYGKDLDWSPYTVHDSASVLRRYLNSMPEPVIPATLYRDFTAVLQKSDPLPSLIAQYRTLISLLPPTSRYLLLYLLDFLSVFARCSASNLMTASNLAVVFQPGLVSTRKEADGEGALLGFPGFNSGQVPSTDPTAEKLGQGSVGAKAKAGAGEHGKGKEVLEFLIEQQSHFVLGLEPPVQGGLCGVLRDAQERSGGGMLNAARGEAIKSEAATGADLSRRGSEKSVERRRLRKNAQVVYDEDGVKVKRSRTLPGGSTRRKKESPSSTAKASPRTSPPTTPTFAVHQTLSSSAQENDAGTSPALQTLSLLEERKNKTSWSPLWKGRKSPEPCRT